MRIIIITEYFPDSPTAKITGGIEALCFHTAKRLAKKHKVTILCSHQKGQKKINRFENFTVYRCGPLNPFSHEGNISNILRRLAFTVAAFSKGLQLKSDVIEGFSFLGYIPAALLGIVKRNPKIARYHETWLGKSWIKNKGILTGTLGNIWEKIAVSFNWDKIISVSSFTKEQLIKKSVPASKIVVIPNGADIEACKKLEAKKYKQPTISCVARLIKTKRIDTLIKAVSLVKKDIPEIKCRIVGGGEEKNNLKMQIASLKLEKNVTLLGFVKKNEDVLKEIKKSDIFCHPSAVEGFGIVIIEAMACGIPYVCSDIPPFVEVTKNGTGGRIFKLNDSDDLAQKILQVLRLNKTDRTALIKEGNKQVLSYSWDNTTKQTEQVYLQTIANWKKRQYKTRIRK
jgi:glycosyltransferase involved in cell wall biosynthesis